MTRTFITFGSFALLALGSGPAMADTRAAAADAESLTAMIACRQIPEADQRLACFDAAIGKLDAAIAQKDVVVVTRTEIKAARKSVFGLSLPKIGIFGGNDAKDTDRATEEEGVGYIEAKLTDARQGSDGKWTLILEDGARWAQTDTANIRMPKPGDVVRIRKAALGSFMANINGRPAIRVRRLS